MSKSKKVFAPSTSNYQFASNTVKSLDGLVVRRKNWESAEYKKSNEILYSLLAECLDVFNAQFMAATDDDKKTLRLELINRLKNDGVKVQSNSTTLTMFVRFVFGSDRKRAHGYAYVLKAAISHQIEASKLADWITNEGGIEEVKRRMVQSEESIAKQAKLATAKTQVIGELEQSSITPLAEVQINGLSGSYALLLAKPLPNRKAAIIGTLSGLDIDEALYNSLILRMAKRKSKDDEDFASLSKETQDLLLTATRNSNLLKKAA